MSNRSRDVRLEAAGIKFTVKLTMSNGFWCEEYIFPTRKDAIAAEKLLGYETRKANPRYAKGYILRLFN
jgi:hypothetical protein